MDGDLPRSNLGFVINHEIKIKMKRNESGLFNVLESRSKNEVLESYILSMQFSLNVLNFFDAITCFGKK